MTYIVLRSLALCGSGSDGLLARLVEVGILRRFSTCYKAAMALQGRSITYAIEVLRIDMALFHDALDLLLDLRLVPLQLLANPYICGPRENGKPLERDRRRN